MKTPATFVLGVFLFAACFAAHPGEDWSAQAKTEATPPPGEGVVCLWAIMTVAREVGRLCHAGENAEVQAELERSVSRI